MERWVGGADHARPARPRTGGCHKYVDFLTAPSSSTCASRSRSTSAMTACSSMSAVKAEAGPLRWPTRGRNLRTGRYSGFPIRSLGAEKLRENTSCVSVAFLQPMTENRSFSTVTRTGTVPVGVRHIGRVMCMSYCSRRKSVPRLARRGTARTAKLSRRQQRCSTCKNQLQHPGERMEPKKPNNFDWLKYFKGHPTHAVIALGIVMSPAIIFAVKW